MNVVIFGGFLGSGKTSMILSLAHYIAEKENSLGSRGLVIIENEIGEIGVDDKILKSNGYQVRELFAGCICCTLSADLTMMLNDLEDEIHPKWVIIECTGLAYPSKIIKTLEQYGIGIESIRTVTVIDAERWEELMTVAPVLTSTQVAEGDFLLINKIDLIDVEVLSEVESSVKKINERAKLYQLSATSKIRNNLWNEVIGIGE